MVETPFELDNDIGWKLRGEVRAGSDGASGLVVISHGFKGFKDWGFFPWLSRRLAAEGFVVVTFNFSGSGIGVDPLQFTEYERFNENTLSLEVGDLSHVLDAALGGRLPGVPRNPDRGAVLLGHSRGAVSSLVVASRTPSVRAVVTWAGIGSLEARYDESTRKEWRRNGFLEVLNARTGQVFRLSLTALDDLECHLEDYDPLRIIQSLDVPVLAIHGVADATIPIDESRMFVKNGRRDLVQAVEIEEAGHTFEAVHPFQGPTPALEQALETTLRFLKSSRG